MRRGGGEGGNKNITHVNLRFFSASSGALRNHSPLAPTLPSSGKPLPLDFRRVWGWIWAPNWPKVGGAAPGFEPRTSCMRVGSTSHYATGTCNL